jgi:hypothetical protein
MDFKSPLWNRGEAEHREAGGCFRRRKNPPVSLREPSPLLRRGDANLPYFFPAKVSTAGRVTMNAI